MEQEKSKILIITESLNKEFYLHKLIEILRNLEIHGKGFKLINSIKFTNIRYKINNN
jgi:hypothetical protein